MLPFLHLYSYKLGRDILGQARDGNTTMKDVLLGQISGLSIPISLSDTGNGKGCQIRAWDADPFQQPIPVYTAGHLHMLLTPAADRLKVTVTSGEIQD